MVFVKHKVRRSSNQMNPGETKALFSVKVNSFSDADTSDQASHMDQADSSGPVPPGKNHIDITGPVVIHGYSARIFTDFFGIIYQGMSAGDDDFTIMDKDNYRSHAFGLQNASIDGTDDQSRQSQRQEEAIKNLKYCMGYRYQPSRGSLLNLMGVAGLAMSNEEYAANYPKGLQLGTAHLQKKFDRTKLRHTGGGNFRKSQKSGFVLVPNTPTEFFSIGLTNAQHSLSEANDITDGWYYADLTIWMSYDNY